MNSLLYWYVIVGMVQTALILLVPASWDDVRSFPRSAVAVGILLATLAWPVMLTRVLWRLMSVLSSKQG